MSDDADPSDEWMRLAPFARYKSDLLLNISVTLTEPVCASAVVCFEFPERAGVNSIAQAFGDTAQEAADKAMAKARQYLTDRLTQKQP